MITGSKGQGLPINTIILIAVGLLILVLFITFLLGGFKNLGIGTSGNNGLAAFQQTCEGYSTYSLSSAAMSSWCTQVGTNPNGAGTYHCYSNFNHQPAGNSNSTTITLYNGTTIGYTNCVDAGLV